ncbi:thioredoxin family protein [Dyadobacter sp. NIV53]|uniref:thioredoxin family protein n=1 Tax=Dyadobacter sp. NIV53 TaxID=2861765 RepID=UPI001E5C7E90|nr:thioredoxin family protein [Dyadobacter sp. NIV53]
MKKFVPLLTTIVLSVILTGMCLKDDGYKIGDEVQNFSLMNVNGEMVSLTDKQYVKGYIIAFTSNTCPVSKAYENRIMALNEKFEPRGYPVIAIQANDVRNSPADSYSAMQQKSYSRNYRFPYLYDEDQSVTRAFGATSTPQMFVLHLRNNRYKVAYIGALDNNQASAFAASQRYVENAVNELLAGRPVSLPSARAVGCGIKWKKSV